MGAETSGRLKVRVNLGFLAEPEEPAGRSGRVRRNARRVEAEEWLTARTMRFFADGVIKFGAAALLEPDADCAHSHGSPTGAGRN
jgi:hypothetical protein